MATMDVHDHDALHCGDGGECGGRENVVEGTTDNTLEAKTTNASRVLAATDDGGFNSVRPSLMVPTIEFMERAGVDILYLWW